MAGPIKPGGGRSVFDQTDPLALVADALDTVFTAKPQALLHVGLQFKNYAAGASERSKLRLVRLPRFVEALAFTLHILPDCLSPIAPSCSGESLLPLSLRNSRRTKDKSSVLARACSHVCATLVHLLLTNSEIDYALIPFPQMLPGLVKALAQDMDGELQVLACTAIDLCVAAPDFRSMVATTEHLLGQLVRIVLVNPDDRVLFHGLRAIANMAADPASRFVVCRTPNLLPCVASCLLGPVGHARKHSLAVLAELVQARENHVMIAREQDCVAALLSLHDSVDAEEMDRERAASVLETLAADPLCQRVLQLGS
jgi:hypothetical protein